MKYHNPDIKAVQHSWQESEKASLWRYLNWLPPQNEKGLRPLCQESRKLMHKDVLNLVRLFDLDTDSYTVDAGFNEYPLILVARHVQFI